MDGEGCWSTVVSSPAERRALGLPDSAGWMLQCRLGIGHRGNHATDGSSQPRADRRFWLEWNDFDQRAQSLIERNPCPIRSTENAACLYFHGHPGPHAYARANGHAPSAMVGASVRGMPRPAEPPHPQESSSDTVGPSQSNGPVSGDLPIVRQQTHRGADPTRSGSHRMPDSYVAAEAASADDSLYRGGRRSTDSAPPHDQLPYLGRRHSFDGGPGGPAVSPVAGAHAGRGPAADTPAPDAADAAGARPLGHTAPPSGHPGTAQPSGQPATAPPRGQPVTAPPSGQPATAPPSGQPVSAWSDAGSVSAALNEVAAALNQLARALRKS